LKSDRIRSGHKGDNEMKNLFLGIIPLFLLLGASIVIAAGAEDAMVTRARNDAEIKKLAAQMNTACGTSIDAKVEWDSFTGSDWENYSVSSFCGAPLKTMSDFCSAAKGNSKAYIKKNLKEVTCSYGGEGKRAIRVENGAIENIVDFTSSNLDEFVHAALLKDF
jgi:hypothetical protein